MPFKNILSKVKNVILMFALLFFVNISSAQKQDLSRQDSALLSKYTNAYEHFKPINDKEASRFLNYIGNIYWENNHNRKAVEYYLKSLKINKKIGNENGISMINSNLGLLYSDLSEYNKSLECFKKTLAYRRTQKDKRDGLISTLLAVSVVLDKLQKYDAAIEKVLEALQFSKEQGDALRLQTCYGTLAELYEKEGDSKNSVKYFNLYREFNSMILDKKQLEIEREKSQKKLAELRAENKRLEALRTKEQLDESKDKNKDLLKNLSKAQLKVEVLKRDAEIYDLQAKEIKLKAKQNKERRRKTLIIISLVGFFVLVFIVFIIIAYRRKIKTNNKLEFKNQEILQQSEEITLQRDSLESAFREIEIQKNNLNEAYNEIELKNKHITGSIEYAKFIQTAMLNKHIKLSKYFSESFILYEPKEIVSGDFYWYSKVDNKLIVAAVDCTGHGVPGAFLSMLGNNILRNIVETEKITDPSKILYAMNDAIKDTLNQENSESEDGMDMAICTIDKTQKKLYFAGAIRPLIMIQNNKLSVVEGDIFGIGGLEFSKHKKEFNTKEFDIANDTYIYMFSDGYCDQIGDQGKKFMFKRFKNLLQEIHQNPPEEQFEILVSEFDKHKGTKSQVDDILVMGLKI